MNRIKVEPNSADNDARPERLPPIEEVVHVIFVNDFDNTEVLALGGRVEGEDGWLWAVNDNGNFERGCEGDLTADDEYRVTHWAAIEWPETKP